MMPRPLFRLLRALVRGLLILIWMAAMWTLRQIFMFIRFALPYVIRTTLSGLWIALELMAAAVLTMFRGFAVVRETSERWVGIALASGFPLNWEIQLRTTFNIVITMAILLGWVILLFSGYIAADWGYSLIFHR